MTDILIPHTPQSQPEIQEYEERTITSSSQLVRTQPQTTKPSKSARRRRSRRTQEAETRPAPPRPQLNAMLRGVPLSCPLTADNDDKLRCWEEHEKTLKKAELTELIIESNKYRFKDNKLVLKDYPKLKRLYAANCGLKAVDIDVPTLKSLNLHGNKLTELDLTKEKNGAVINRFPVLKTLTVSENQRLTDLDPQRLPNLVELFCFKCRLNKIDASNLTQLKHLSCANQLVVLDLLKVQGCNNLEILDAAENKLCKLDCSNLPNLWDVSVKECYLERERLRIEQFLSKFKVFFGIDLKRARLSYLSDLNYLSLIEQNEQKLTEKLKAKASQEIKQLIRRRLVEEKDCVDIDANLFDVNLITKRISNCFYSVIASNNAEVEIEIKKFNDTLPSIDDFCLNANFDNCTSLERLDFAKSHIGNLSVTNCPNLKNVTGGWLNTVPDLDENNQEQYAPDFKNIVGSVTSDILIDILDSAGNVVNTKAIPFSSTSETNPEYEEFMARWNNGIIEGTDNIYRRQFKCEQIKPKRNLENEPWYDVEHFWRDKNRFPNLESIDIDNLKANVLEDDTYGPRIEQRRQEWEQERLKNQGLQPLTHFTATHQHLEEIVINGDLFQGALEYINLGNNFLKKAVIKNCPRLKFLNVSHNCFTNLEQDIVLENCGVFSNTHGHSQMLRSNWDGRGVEVGEGLYCKDNKPWIETQYKPLQTLILDPTDSRYNLAAAPPEIVIYFMRKRALEMVAHPENFTPAQIIAMEPQKWGASWSKELQEQFGALHRASQRAAAKQQTADFWTRLEEEVEAELQRQKAEQATKPKQPAPRSTPPAPPQLLSPAAALKAKLRAAFAPLLAQFRAAIQKGDKTQQQNLLAEMEQLLQEGGTHLSAEQQAEFTQVKNIWRKQEAQERRVGYGVALFTTGLLVGILVGIGRQLKAFVRPRKKQ